jgi:DNA-binding LacI/PurR family transcriptional regulator
MTTELNAMLTARRYRVVTVDTMPVNFRGRYVGFDKRKAATMALDHLAELGHRRIMLLVNEPHDQLTVTRYVASFRRHADELGLGDSNVVSCSPIRWKHAFDAAYNAMPEVWSAANRPTAIVAISGYGAMGALKWLAERGIRVPEDVCIVSGDDIPSVRFTHPSITAIADSAQELIDNTLEMLWNNEARETLLEPVLVVRESTAPISEI